MLAGKTLVPLWRARTWDKSVTVLRGWQARIKIAVELLYPAFEVVTGSPHGIELFRIRGAVKQLLRVCERRGVVIRRVQHDEGHWGKAREVIAGVEDFFMRDAVREIDERVRWFPCKFIKRGEADSNDARDVTLERRVRSSQDAESCS